MSGGGNTSKGDTPKYFEDILEDEDDSFSDVDSFEEDSWEDSEGEALDFEEANDDVNPVGGDVAEEIVVDVDVTEHHNLYPAEDLGLYQEPTGDIALHQDPADDVAVYQNMDIIEQSEVEGGGDDGDNVDNDEEWLPERHDVAAQLGVRGRVRGARARGAGRGRGESQGRGQGWGWARFINAPGNRAWKKGDVLEEVYATDEDIPEEIREQMQSPGSSAAVRGRGPSRREIEDGANDERADDAFLEDRGMIDDIMNEFKAYCRSDEGAFEWKSMASFQGAKELFQVNGTGPTRVFQNAYDAFREYWDDAILQHIVDSTNVYGDAVAQTELTFHKHWYHTNAHEILTLFAFWIMLGVVRMPSIKSCFSNEVLLKTDVFRVLFTQDRYWCLNRALCFAPDETQEQNPDKLRHIRPILTHLNRKFKECYVPSQDISIDESLTLWRGNIPFRQYIRTNAAKFGIKTYELCEASSGYLWSFFIYTGKASGTTEFSAAKTVKIVLRLILPLLGKGYQVFMNNFFNSPLLARFLKRKQTDCVGAVKRTRKEIPPVIKKHILLRGSYLARHADDVVLLALTDRKPLIMISTHHGPRQSRKVRAGHPSQYKFVAVTDYNIGKGGVDKKDQMLEPYRMMERKQCKMWFKKCFKRLLNVTILNSWILVKKSGGDAGIQLDFRMELVKQIMQKHLQFVPKLPRAPVARSETCYPPNRVVCNENMFHSMKKINETRPGSKRSVSVPCRWCRDRNHVRTRTSYECEKCKIPLCIEPCFKQYHTRH